MRVANGFIARGIRSILFISQDRRKEKGFASKAEIRRARKAMRILKIPLKKPITIKSPISRIPIMFILILNPSLIV